MYKYIISLELKKKIPRDKKSIFSSTSQKYFKKKPGNGGSPAILIINTNNIKEDSPPNQFAENKTLFILLKMKNKGKNIAM